MYKWANIKAFRVPWPIIWVVVIYFIMKAKMLDCKIHEKSNPAFSKLDKEIYK